MLLSLQTDIGDVLGILVGVIMLGCILAGVIALSVMGYRQMRRKGPQ
jgi:ABC-type glucose/galactose transport system permease subunit